MRPSYFMTCQSVENFIHVLTMAGEEENTNPKVWEAVAMADHFEKIQKLPDKIDGVPNFRRVPGYKVYCCGQPTIAGFEAELQRRSSKILEERSTNRLL